MKVIIIGGVAAGMSAAAKIKRIDSQAEVIVYERKGFLSYGACGLPYYVGGFNEDYRRMIARTKEKFEEIGIQCNLHHEVIRIDVDAKQVIIKDLVNDKILQESYDKVMIATGAKAIMPPFEGEHLLGVHTMKTLEDGIFLREYVKSEHVKKVVIVGGGYIGIECAECFLHLGKEVRIVEAADRILKSFDEELAAYATKELEEKGVSVQLLEKVQRFVGDKTIQQVETDKGSYHADLVIVAVGVRPDTQFLKDTGILTTESGAIRVNRKLETSIADIYAAGDCIQVYNRVMEEDSYLALGTVANKCGRIAGSNIMGRNEEFMGALGSAAIKVCDLELGRTGLGEEAAKKKGIAYKSITIQAYDHPAYYPDPTPIFIKLIYESGSKRILGAQLCGQKGAVLRVDIFAVAIQAGMTTEELGMTDLIYAPPFAGVWDAVHIACNAAK